MWSHVCCWMHKKWNSFWLLLCAFVLLVAVILGIPTTHSPIRLRKPHMAELTWSTDLAQNLLLTGPTISTSAISHGFYFCSHAAIWRRKKGPFSSDNDVFGYPPPIHCISVTSWWPARTDRFIVWHTKCLRSFYTKIFNAWRKFITEMSFRRRLFSTISFQRILCDYKMCHFDYAEELKVMKSTKA